MRSTSKRLMTAAAIVCSTCAGAFASAAQASPGNGAGLVPFPLICTNQAGATFEMMFELPGALNAAIRGTGAANAPFPGALVAVTETAGTSPLPPLGEYAILEPQNGQKTGLQSNQLVCPGSPTLVVAPTGQRH